MTHAKTNENAAARVYLADYQPAPWFVPRINITFELAGCSDSNTGRPPVDNGLASQDCGTLVTAKMFLQRNPNVPRAPISLDAKDIPKLVRVVLDNQELTAESFTLKDDLLIIPTELDECELMLVTLILPESNKSCEGLYQSGSIYCTQMEAQGFRRVTFFPDRPDILSVFTTTIVGSKDKFPVMLSNGNLVEAVDLGNGLHKVVYHDPFPKPSYLFALVAGRLESIKDKFTTRSGKDVHLEIFSEPHNVGRLDYAMRCLKQAFKWDEDEFGFEYDLNVFNVVAVGDFNAGAMENKSLNIFNELLIVGDLRTASDQRLERIDRVIAHEYFHNYTGDRITCRSWFELTLKEGLTVRRDTMYGETVGSPTLTRIDTVNSLRERVFPESLGPNKHPIRPESFVTIDNFYTGTVYEGGSEVIRMGQLLIGEAKFKEGMTRYFELFDGQAVSCEDFWEAMSQVSGYNFEKFFRWYYQGGFLRVAVTDRYDPATREYTLTFKQDLSGVISERGAVLPFEFPVLVGLLDATGNPLQLRLKGSAEKTDQALLVCSQEVNEFTFVDLPSAPIPSLFRGFSALLEYDYDYSEDQLLLLLQSDDDEFNRYEATQRLYRNTLVQAYQQTLSGGSIQVNPTLVAAVGDILGDPSIEPGFAARLLALPSLIAMGGSLNNIDFQVLWEAYLGVLRQLTAPNAAAYKNRLESTIQALAAIPDLASHDARQLRALRNHCLGTIDWTEPEYVASKALDLVRNAQCMSDEAPALAILCRRDSSERDAALELFEERWENHEDVFLAYFSLQVQEYQGDATTLVAQLAQDARFKANNPNYVRSLYGAFCRNFSRFHSSDGSGYQLIAELIVSLESFNEVLAARMAKVFDQYSRLDLSLKQPMRIALEHIATKGKRTRAVSEVVDNILSE